MDHPITKKSDSLLVSAAIQRKCAVKTCRSVRQKKSVNEINFHRFPVEPMSRRKWLQSLNLSEKDAVRHPTVCSLHFSPKMYVDHSSADKYLQRRRLLRSAYPDILDPPVEQTHEFRLKKIVTKTQENLTITTQILYCDHCQKGFHLGHNHKNDKHVLVPANQLVKTVPEPEVKPPTKTENSPTHGDTLKVDIFKCHFCTKTFMFRKSIYQHLRNVHQNIPIKKPSPARPQHDHACTECNKRFSTTGNLNKHMKRHKDEKLFQCDTCGDRFYDGDVLKKHVRKHTGEKPYACDSCDKKFALNSSLNMHKLVHQTKNGKVECKQCQKSFSASFYLQHRILHDTPERYKCQLCSKAFCNVNKLKVHTMMHTDERPIKCPVCCSRFRTDGNFKQHMRLHIRNDQEAMSAGDEVG